MTGPNHQQSEGVRWRIVGIGVIVAAVFATATLVFHNPSPERWRPTHRSPADSLLAVWTAAAGGPGVLEEVSPVSLTVTRITYDTLSRRPASVESHDVWIRWAADGPAVRIERPSATGPTVLGFEGGSAWARYGDELAAAGSSLRAHALRATHEILQWLEPPYSLRDSGVAVAYRGPSDRSAAENAPSPVGPTAADPISAHTLTVAFDAPAGLPTSYTYHFALSERVPAEVTYSYRGRTVREVLGPLERAGPMSFVTRRDVYAESGERIETILIADLVIHADATDGRFGAPPG